MDSNKDEALRCVRIAEEAIASRNKDRALKFIKIAQRLNGDLPVDELLAACASLDSGPSSDDKGSVKNVPAPVQCDKVRNGERNYTDEHVLLIRKIKTSMDYYAILGVEKSCSVEEVRKAYRKLSLKVHPDKNKAPGAEEAFKKVCKAFKCLSDLDSRRQYDRTGLVDEFENNQRHNVRRRQRRTAHDLFDDEFDPDDIFRSFFGGQTDMFSSAHVHRTRAMGRQQQEEFHGGAAGGGGGGGSNLIILLQILPFLLIFLLAYLPYSEPEYALHKNYSYQIPKTTEKYGVEFYVKSSTFDDKYPLGSPGRANIEENVIKDYKNILWRHCHVELQRRHWNKNFPTPHCNKLQNLGLA